MSTILRGTAVQAAHLFTVELATVHIFIQHSGGANVTHYVGQCLLYLSTKEINYSLLLKVGHDRQHSGEITLVRRQPKSYILIAVK